MEEDSRTGDYWEVIEPCYLGIGWGCLVGLLGAVPLSAQVVTGTISGRIADTTGAVIPGAAVQIQNGETGLTRSVETDATRAENGVDNGGQLR